MTQHVLEPNTPAWRFQVWASFAISFGMTLIGIAYLPVDNWTRAFMGMGVLFTVGSAFTLAKTVRDDHEAEKLTRKVENARTEKLLTEYGNA